jgi:hypothetical protein
MATGMRAPTSPIGRPDVIWGVPGTGGMLTEWAETVPDLIWPESIRTYGRMRRDARITSILAAFFLPILRTTWAVDPAGVSRAEAVDLVAGNLGLPILGEKGLPPASPVRGYSWTEHLRLALLNLVYGMMPFEQWYEIRKGRTQLAGLQERQPHTVNIIDIDDQGYVRQVWQNTQEQPIAANRLLWYAHDREGANYAGTSMLRPCYTPWILKHETMRVHATSIRRFGMGVPAVKAPPGATPGQIEEARRLAAGMRAGDAAGAGLPDGFQFELTGLSGSVPDAVAFLGYCDQQMTASCLAQIVELGHGTYGSRALGESFLDLFLLSLQAVADRIGDTITWGDPTMPGVARSLVEYNWGEGEPVPRVVATDVGDRHEITAAALSALVTCGALQPDEQLDTFIREAWGLPERDQSHPYLPPGPPSKPGPETKVLEKGTPPAPPGGKPPGSGPGAAPATASSRLRAARTAGPRPDGLRRALTAVEAASGIDPAALRYELERARDRLLSAWGPVAAAQRADLADQVSAAIDAGRLDQLAALQVDSARAADLLMAAMDSMVQQGINRAIAEAAAQGVRIEPSRVKPDAGRLAQQAQARASLAAQYTAQQAAKRALRVTQASAGSEAARDVTAHLEGLSPVPLADQLMAAMVAASNAGRLAVFDAGPDATYTATEILDANTCAPCAQIDGYQYPDLGAAVEDYGNGGYLGCLGELRCRGTVIARWPGTTALGDAPGPPPFPRRRSTRTRPATNEAGGGRAAGT